MTDTGLEGTRILLVEDDLSSRLYLNKILERAGAFIINAGNGKEAVDMALSDRSIRIILMDIQLPVMDGYTAAQQIKKSFPETIIIAQTAYGMTADMEKLVESGFDDYIVKPIFAGMLIDLIKKHLKLT